MDGVRIAAGWVRELQGRWLGSIGVDWRSADGLQSPHRAPMALYGSCDARDGERIRSRELSRTGVARVCGEVGSVAGWQSGGEWNGSQPCQGATELGFPRPMLGKMQGKAARRSGDPSHQSEEPPSEGFGGRDPFTQADAGCPAGQVVRHHLYRQPGAVGGEAPRGHVVQPDAVLEVEYRILDLGVAAMISLQFANPTPSFGGFGLRVELFRYRRGNLRRNLRKTTSLVWKNTLEGSAPIADIRMLYPFGRVIPMASTTG